ncbi:hypothetical protein B0T14DRAFT_605936 [Immersiella caudata]|uniref:Uncharacterized protein n=1 Tax=Immersiella caudata TaxID=314043 RepID=A0AA39WDJ0_9PEZI|nr:hypothetical protein B0T14DRAFT_605936 [Immersiella caudata]
MRRKTRMLEEAVEYVPAAAVYEEDDNTEYFSDPEYRPAIPVPRVTKRERSGIRGAGLNRRGATCRRRGVGRNRGTGRNKGVGRSSKGAGLSSINVRIHVNPNTNTKGAGLNNNSSSSSTNTKEAGLNRLKSGHCPCGPGGRRRLIEGRIPGWGYK